MAGRHTWKRERSHSIPRYGSCSWWYLLVSPYQTIATAVTTDPATLKRLVQEPHTKFKDVKDGKPAANNSQPVFMTA